MLSTRIDNLEKMLSRMGVEGRQKYAADNMDDPIAVLTALYVNNEDKKQKLSKQGASEIKNPVVPQAIQAMTQPQMPQGGPPQGMPPQGMPPQGPPQGPPPQGMPPQGMPQQAMPPQGPPQGMPPPQGQPQMAADGGYMDSRLPEDMGIGALPERSLSNMADGGIVGFADGGDVQQFQSGGTPKPQPMYPGMIRQEGEGLLPNTTGYENMGILEFIQKFGVDAYNKIKNAIPGETTEERRARLKQEVYDATPSGQRDKAMAVVNAPAPIDSMSFPPRVLGPYSQTGVLPNQAGSGGAEDPNGAGPPRPAPPRPAPAAGAGAGAGTPPSAKASGLQTLLTSPDLTPEAIAATRKKFTDLQPPVVDPLKADRQALVDESNTNAAAELTGFKERMAKQGDPYAKQEERANKQEASIAESAERSPYLALMEAGFAMMSGDSPYAMVNIGKGALAGTKTYREGLALLEKAKEKLNETRDRIDGLRLIRSDLNDKEERDIQRETRRTALEGKTIMFNALEKLTGESKAQVENNVKLFMESAEKGKDRSLQAGIADLNARTQTGIAAANRAMQLEIAKLPGGPEKLYSVLGDGDVKKGFKYWSEATAESKGDEAIALALAKDPLLLEGLKTSNPAAYAAFMARMSGNGGFTVRGSSPTK